MRTTLPILLLVLLVAGSSPAAEKTTTVVENLGFPGTVVAIRQNQYAVLNRIEGDGFVYRTGRKNSGAWFPGLKEPAGMAYDERRGILFVLEGERVRFLRFRDGAETAVVQVPGSNLRGAAFSLMNRRLYVSDAVSGEVWEVHPKKKTVERLLERGAFEALGRGGPASLAISIDGKRLYIGTDLSAGGREAEAALLEFSIQDRKVRLFRSVPETKRINAIELYGPRFLVSDGPSGVVWIVPNGETGNSQLLFPKGTVSSIGGFALDANNAIVSEPGVSPGAGRLLRIPFRLQ